MKLLFAGVFAAVTLVSANGGALAPEYRGTPSVPPAASDSVPVPPTAPESAEQVSLPAVRITVGAETFTAMLYDNESARALLDRLPLTLSMEDLNANEKFHFLADALPASAEKIEQIHAGDFMLYGGDCLVLFYKSFSSSYSYTPLGRISDVDGFAEAVGAGDVTVALAAG